MINPEFSLFLKIGIFAIRVLPENYLANNSIHKQLPLTLLRRFCIITHISWVSCKKWWRNMIDNDLYSKFIREIFACTCNPLIWRQYLLNVPRSLHALLLLSRPLNAVQSCSWHVSKLVPCVYHALNTCECWGISKWHHPIPKRILCYAIR